MELVGLALKKDFPKGHVVVQFFEDPPQYGSVPISNLKVISMEGEVDDGWFINLVCHH